MRLKHHILLYTFLGVAVLISIFLTLDYGNRAQRSAQALEDAYAQRVLETQEHLQAIGLKLGKAPVATDARTQVELLAGISRQADNVVSGLSALPLSHIAMSDTLKFCNQLSEYAMVLALSVSAGQPADRAANHGAERPGKPVRAAAGAVCYRAGDHGGRKPASDSPARGCSMPRRRRASARWSRWPIPTTAWTIPA